MVTLRDVLDTALRLHRSQAGVARAVNRTRATVSAWYVGRSKPDYAACVELASATGMPVREVLEAAGYDASQFPVTATKAQSESALRARQQGVRRQLDRWVRVLGPRMGDEAAEDYFWESVRQHTDTILDAFTRAQTAVNPPPDGAVNADVSAPPKSESGRRRRGNGGLRASYPEGSFSLASLLGNVNDAVAA